ncbi:MAG: hypothetical protein AAF962_10405 [Actinomycetota bacterium]
MHLRLTVAGFAAALLLAACGGDDGGTATDAADAPVDAAADANSDTGGGETGGTDEGSGEPAADPAAEDAAPSGGGSGTVTVGDGTVYEITDLSSCITGATDPDALPSTGYDLIGRTADGAWLFTAIRAGFSDDETLFSGALEGGFDADGKNASIIYPLRGDGSTLVVDGGTVTGTVEAKPLGPNQPHGDETTFTVDFSC